MTTNNNGWNPLTRDPMSVMTDSFDVGGGINMHDTFKFDAYGNIQKFHTTINAPNSNLAEGLKVYAPYGHTNLQK